MKVGDSIGRYTVLRHLATGGMGELWLARRTHARAGEATLVLKQLHPVMAFDRAFVEMFIDEARIASQLDHPNVVRVHGLEEHEDACFIVMEHLRGQPLSALLTEAARRRTRLPLTVAAGIIIDACAGLHHVHTRSNAQGQPLKIVHRDVAPDNLILTHDGTVKLVDFGIARAVERLHRTRAGQVKGKRPYMSPEQFMGLPVGPPADVYALAVVFHELLTGQQLFPPGSLGPMHELELRQQPEPPSRLVPGLPGLDALVLHALRYEAADRLSDCASFAEGLQACLAAAGMTVSAAQRAALIAAWLPLAEGEEEPDEQDEEHDEQAQVTTDPRLSAPSHLAAPSLELSTFGPSPRVARSLGSDERRARIPGVFDRGARKLTRPAAATAKGKSAQLEARVAAPGAVTLALSASSPEPSKSPTGQSPTGQTAQSGHTGPSNDAGPSGLPGMSRIARIVEGGPITASTRLPEHADAAEPPRERSLLAGSPQLLVAGAALVLVAGLVLLLYRPAQAPLPEVAEPEPAATELPVPRPLPVLALAPLPARLSLTTSAPVLVSEKGVSLGRTPLRALPLSPGRHHLRLVDVSIGIDQQIDFDLVSEKELKRRIVFPSATLNVRSLSPARLLVDGLLAGPPPQQLNLSLGTHTIELRNETNGRALRESLVLRSTEILTLICNLESGRCGRSSVQTSNNAVP